MQANRELAPVETVTHFQNKETEYRSWVSTNPEGFVLNIRAPWESHTHKLHTARCKLKDNTASSTGAAPFTGGDYSKVCSLDPRAVLRWAEHNIPNGTARVGPCGGCKPDLTIDLRDGFARAQLQLDGEVAKSLRDSEKARRQRLEQAQTKPVERYVLTRVFDRNPDVIAEVLHQARGICGGCGKPAPFQRKSTGRPYLEVHHVLPLAQGGHDTVANAIALCPNCHREQHYG